ncbi:MAG: hypothetical protein MJ252_03985 [archaeon]|nr:hypothetical protein [archaeon]
MSLSSSVLNLLFFLVLFLSIKESQSLRLRMRTSDVALLQFSSFIKKLQEKGEISKHKSQEYLQKNSDKSIELLKEGLPALSGTSCKVAAKYVLFTLGDIQKESDRHYLNLTDNTQENLENMEELLKDGYILQIEVKPNHHFVIFLENGENLYLMQAFQDIFRLKDWIYDEVSSLPMDLKEFMKLFKGALDPTNDEDTFHSYLLQLFLPHSMWEDFDKVNGLFNWFGSRRYLTIVKVDYVKYDFKNTPGKLQFVSQFHKVDHSFFI